MKNGKDWRHVDWKEVRVHRKDASKLAESLPKGLLWRVGREHKENLWCLTILVPPYSHILYAKFLIWCRKHHLVPEELSAQS